MICVQFQVRFFLAALAILMGIRGAVGGLVEARLLDNRIAYFRVGSAGAHLDGEISSAEAGWAATNQPVGTILDLRNASGAGPVPDAVASFFANRNQPLAVLVDEKTQGAADHLALALQANRTGLVFGSPTADVQPDIMVKVSSSDEMLYLANPYAVLDTNNPAGEGTGTNFVPYVDHTSEADLVRDKIKDGDEDENTPIKVAPSKPVIRDPALARAVDLINAMAILRLSRS